MTISVHLFKQMRSSVLQHQIAWFVLKSPCQTNFEQEPKYRLRAGCCSRQAEISPFWVNCTATAKEKENTRVSWLVLCYISLPCHFSHRFCCTVFRGASDSRNKIMQRDYVPALCHSLCTPYTCRIVCTCSIWKALITRILS